MSTFDEILQPEMKILPGSISAFGFKKKSNQIMTVFYLCPVINIRESTNSGLDSFQELDISRD